MVTKCNTNEETMQNDHKTDNKCRNDVEWSQNLLQPQKRCRMVKQWTTNEETLYNGHNMDYNCGNAVKW